MEKKEKIAPVISLDEKRKLKKALIEQASATLAAATEAGSPEGCLASAILLYFESDPTRQNLLKKVM